jgi:hypothetical protein
MFNVEVRMYSDDESKLSPYQKLQMKRGRMLQRLVLRLEHDEIANSGGKRK